MVQEIKLAPEGSNNFQVMMTHLQTWIYPNDPDKAGAGPLSPMVELEILATEIMPMKDQMDEA